ncbi:MAG: Asp-tRNA(Asn)/Glu-tRNA(Gln) amidotransferase subunit GatA [Candidatus Riflebacteria bacterium]|nr:Asp-tRNA(Asn)/Glu-tRNA(Gln) amidotransferase subunit GatA [Candidatus Riflebacteria bacterium]
MSSHSFAHPKTISEIRSLYHNEKVSVPDFAELTASNIEKQDSRLGAFLNFDRKSLISRAQEIEKQRSNLEKYPLFGIPIAVKDNISTAGIKTTCGSKMLENYVPVYDASVIKRLVDMGALIVGKTNLDEFGMGSSTENSAFFPTKNPWDTERVPGGSSGGSAAAVAAGMVPVALGSDTGGSIRQPAAFTGILGLKCTYGLISRFGLVAYASSLDQIGPLARSAEDIALILDAIAFKDAKDSTSAADPNSELYSKSIGKSISGLKAGLPREFLAEGISPAVKELVLKAAEKFEKLGVKVEETSIPSVKYSLAAYYIIATAEASSNLARFDGIRYGHRAEGKDILELYSSTRAEGFGREVARRILLGTFVLSSGYYDAYYLKAMKVRKLLNDEIVKSFNKYDFLITPTTPDTAFKFGEKTANPLEMYLTDICTIAVNLAGIPAISVPCGLINGLPVGVQLLASRFGERTLISVSDAYLRDTKFNEMVPPFMKEEH